MSYESLPKVSGGGERTNDMDALATQVDKLVR